MWVLMDEKGDECGCWWMREVMNAGVGGWMREVMNVGVGG